MTTSPDVVVVGAGLGGMAAAVVAADRGLRVRLVEKSSKVGGAAAFSGGQVWIGANHAAAKQGLEDSVDDTLSYVLAAAAKDPQSVDVDLATQWIEGARDAASYFEQNGVIRWEVIPDYPDYYFPDLPGSRPVGRYLTGALFEGQSLGAQRELLHVTPHFPVGVTYPEMFSWGGMSSRTRWDWGLVERRRADDLLSFGTGIAAAFFKAVLERGVEVLTSHEVAELLTDHGQVTGVRCHSTESDDIRLAGSVILATGAHDWNPQLTGQFTGIPPSDGGSVAPDSLAGDGVALVEAVGGQTDALPPWAAPVLPGYRLLDPVFDGDTGYRACYEHCLPHTFLVNRDGRRFCDDSFHSEIVRAALSQDGNGAFSNLPFFMVWDSQHHKRYGLGRTMPGGAYPDGLVASAASLEELANVLGVSGVGLADTAEQFNNIACSGKEDEYGRGSNLSVRRFRGDWSHEPNPCVGPVDTPPFYGMRMRLLSTGIAAAGVRTGRSGRVLAATSAEIPGLHAVGECAARAAAGVGYNSGYSLSRAMAFGFLAATDLAE